MFLYKIKYHIQSILLKLFYNMHSNIFIKNKVHRRKGFSIIADKNASVRIGSGTFFNNYCSIVAKRKIVIGNNCLFGENVKIYDHNHTFNKKNLPLKEQGFKVHEIAIGDNCWIGSNVVILKGAVVGDNCVIGAGVVLDFPVKSNSIVKRKNDNLIIEEIKYANN